MIYAFRDGYKVKYHDFKNSGFSFLFFIPTDSWIIYYSIAMRIREN